MIPPCFESAISPVGDRLLVRRLADKATQSTVLEVVQFEETPSQFAEVLAVGNKFAEAVSVGDTVVIRKFSGAPTTFGGLEVHFISGDDVLAVLED